MFLYILLTFTGITPIYDAACNGHLEIVQLLLDKGAIPSLKTDFGETPLNVLQKWRTGKILTKDEEQLYNSICMRIHGYIDKTVDLHRSKSKTPVKNVKEIITPPSTSKSSIGQLESPALRRKNIIDDDSDDDAINLSQTVRQQLAFPSDESNVSSDDGGCKNNDDRNSGVLEYKSAITALRNRSIDLPDVDLKKKPKPALLDSCEIDDDWLDDDLGIHKNKKRKLSDPLTVVAKKPSYQSIKDSIESVNKFTTPLVDSNKIVTENSKAMELIEINEHSSDPDSFASIENVSPKVSPPEILQNVNRDSRDNMRRRWKRQSTLLKAGFQRRKEDFDNSSNSGSENEHFNNVKGSTPEQTGNYTTTPRDRFNFVQNIRSNIVKPLNVIQPINIVQSLKNGKPVQTQILPPTAVKVHVEDKTFLISLKLETINKKTISWLVEEVKSRYYK